MSNDMSIFLGGLLLALLLLIIFIFAGKRSHPNKKHFQNQWQKIVTEKNLKLAVLQADALLDEALRAQKIPGETMGERLNNAKALLSNINTAWSAHKLRNKIAHEAGFEPGKTHAQQALRQFKRALKDLGVV